MAEQLTTYRKRQAIVEHPFGTMKRQWGFDYIMTKKFKESASADVGLIFCAYNLRRIFNILNKNVLKEYLKVLFYYFEVIRSHFKAFLGVLISILAGMDLHKPNFKVA